MQPKLSGHYKYSTKPKDATFMKFPIDLAESDLVYTESLMRRGVEKFENKEVLILGGGDGALLYELRKEKPKHVTMIDVSCLIKLPT